MKYLIITKKGILAFFIITILTVSIVATADEKSRQAAAVAGTDNLPIYCVDTSEKKISVTFDAAWGADDIDEILKILDKHNAKASFFIVGTWAEKNPDCVKKIFEKGHDIGNHSYNHMLYSRLSAEDIIADMKKCNEKISGITGVEPTLFRFPSGDYNEISVKILRNEGMQPIQWSVDSLDWQGLSKDEIVKRVTSKVTNGSIVLFHNDVKSTPEALDESLSVLSNEGYSFVNISELIYDKQYHIDAAGKQYKNEE